MVKELEVKILNVNIELMQKKIVEKGGIITNREKQINTLIDSSLRPIKSYMDAYLRIRENHELIKDEKTTTFTLKKNIVNENLRENEEYNVKVDDGKTLLHIMKSLGFDNVTVGYKDRTSYLFMGGRIDIDVWDKETYPYPYMEIEVSEEAHLQMILDELEIPAEKISRLSIVELQKELHKNQEGNNA